MEKFFKSAFRFGVAGGCNFIVLLHIFLRAGRLLFQPGRGATGHATTNTPLVLTIPFTEGNHVKV